MIYPVPAGVDPNSHRCGCGGRLTMPWRQEFNGNALRCVEDPEHNTYQKKDTGTRKLWDEATEQFVEVDILSQRRTDELAPITDKPTALARVTEAKTLGLFPGQQTAGQMDLLAVVALAYRLDPLMGEIMPFQGRPYITIAGRRRLDRAAGYHTSVSFRPPTEDEERYWIRVKAMDARDVVQICVGRDMDSGATVEGFGRVLWQEDLDAGKNSQNREAARANLPIVQRKIEMAQKRAERRMLEQMYGPVAKPASLDGVMVLEEGDEANTVEGEARVIDAKGTDSDRESLPDLGSCPNHQIVWAVKRFHNRIVGSHPVKGEDYCTLDKVYREKLGIAWRQRWGEPDATEVNTWLKDTFDGRTWSKMDANQQVRAVTMLLPAPEGPESDVQPPKADPGSQPSNDAGDAPGTLLCAICDMPVGKGETGAHQSCMDADDARLAELEEATP